MMKILKSLSLIVAVAAVAGGATYAYFSDTETSDGNSVTAGTLDMKVDDKDDPLIEKVTFENAKPGDTITKTWKVKNVGSIPGKVTVKIKNVVDNDNGCTEPEVPAEVAEYGSASCGNGQGELSSYLRTQVLQSHVNYTYADWGISDYHANGMTGKHRTMALYGGLKYQENLPMGGLLSLGHNDYQLIQLIMKLDSDVVSSGDWGGWDPHQVDDNLLQGDSVTFNVEFTMDQTR